MTSDGTADLLKQSHQFFLVLWFANLLTVCLLMGVGFLLASGDPEVDALSIPEGTFADPVVYLLYAIGLGLFFAAYKLPGYLANSKTVEELRNPGPLNPAIKIRLMGPYITRIALMESSAIVGFVLAVISSSYILGLPLMTLSVVALVISRPADELLREIGLSRSKAK